MKRYLLAILTTSLFALPALAQITPGSYTGELEYTESRKKKRTSTRTRDVNVYIQLAEADSANAAIALIHDARRASAALYRIEVLPDGNQLWIKMFQGRNNTLKVNDDASPDYLGIPAGNRIVLNPTDRRRRCNENSIELRRSGDSTWAALPQQSMQFKEGRDIVGQYSVGYGGATFRGQVNLGNQSLSDGDLVSVREALSKIAVIRKTVTDQTSISGYAEERDLVGVVTNIRDRRGDNNLLFIGLPQGSVSCAYKADLLEE